MPMDRSKYPADWELVSAFVRKIRAQDRCECMGECYLDKPFGHKTRCLEINGTTGRYMQGRVILTTAHLCDCNPLCSIPAHLKAMCQSCHLRFDRYHHGRTRAKTLRLRRQSIGTPANPPTLT